MKMNEYALIELVYIFCVFEVCVWAGGVSLLVMCLRLFALQIWGLAFCCVAGSTWWKNAAEGQVGAAPFTVVLFSRGS